MPTEEELQKEIEQQKRFFWNTIQKDSQKSTISRHIKNVLESGELQRNSVVAKNATAQSGNLVPFYLSFPDFEKVHELVHNLN